jgi:hypothetical protein
MENKPIFIQTGFDFDRGKCLIVKNYWGEAWHVKNLDGRTTARAEQPAHFETKEAAEEWTNARGLEVVAEKYSF